MKKITTILISLIASAAIAGGFSDHSGNALNASGNASVKLIQGASQTTNIVTSELYQAMKAGISGAGEFSVAAIAKGADVSTLVITTSGTGSQTVADGTSTVLTNSGVFVSGLIDSTTGYISVAVNASGEVIARGSDMVIGSVKWTSEKAKTAGQYLVNASGKVLNFSGRVVGHVVDTAGNVLTFAVDSTNRIWTVSKDTASLVVTTSSTSIKEGAKLAGQVVSTVVRASGDVLLTTVRASEDVLLTTLKTSALTVDHSAHGRFINASEILVYLPANMLEAALYSEMHYQTLK